MHLVRPGCEISRERTARHIQRHNHLAPYAALVLRGSYVEAGDRGRFRAEAGDVLFHDGFESHQDLFAKGGADILNLHLRDAPAVSAGRIADPDIVARAGETDVTEAVAMLFEQLEPAAPVEDDWPDRLAADIRAGRVAGLADWAHAHRLAPSSVSRGFRLAYGVSPQRFRAEYRAGSAVRAMGCSSLSLAMIAADSGFADQPHFTRTVGRMFGCSPARLRASVKSVQDGAAAAA